MAASVVDVAASLSARSALDERCLALTQKFVQEMAAAEEAFAKAASKASGALVSGLLNTNFAGDDGAARRRALIGASKMAATLASEMQAHARVQVESAASLAAVAADAKATAKSEAATRAARRV